VLIAAAMKSTMAKEYLVAVSTMINATVEANVEGPGTVTNPSPVQHYGRRSDEAFTSNVMAGVGDHAHVAPNVQLSIKLPLIQCP
jgi:hypothetical protein